MANQFLGNPDEMVSWANGLTSVLLARVAVAAAELCETDWQRDFARSVATYDQNRGPLGCVSFDLIDIPWGASDDEYEANKRFVLEAVVHAASDEVANRLPYYPNPAREEAHRESLRAFALLVYHFDRTRFAQPWATAWSYLFPPADVICVRHRMFCHAGGCMACPDDVHARPNDARAPGCGPAHRGSSCSCFRPLLRAE